MKTSSLMLVILAAGCAAVSGPAADRETGKVEKRVVVARDAAPSPGEARAPVTFLGVAVAPAGAALASQLRLPDGQGLVVTLVEPDSPAGKAGLKQHDVLTRLDDQVLIEPRQLSVLVRGHKEGDSVTVSYIRGGAEAKVTVTLATHVPPRDLQFRWTGSGDGQDVFFHTERVAPPEDLERWAPNEAMPHAVPFPRASPGPGAGAPGAGVDGGDRLMFFPPRADLVYSDDAGSLLLRVGEEGQMLTARKPDGSVTFSGPVGTAEQRAALPEELRQRLEKFRAFEVFDAPLPPPGTTGRRVFAPDTRAAPAPVM